MIVPVHTSARERELTAPVALTLPNGRLNPAAIGWARTPLVDTSGIAAARRPFPHQWGRNKRWEYWNVITPTHILALTISSIDYAAVHEAWVFERATERSWGRVATVVPAVVVMTAAVAVADVVAAMPLRPTAATSLQRQLVKHPLSALMPRPLQQRTVPKENKHAATCTQKVPQGTERP